MKVEKNKVVAVFYNIKDEDGNFLDSNEGYEPLEYLHGYSNILPALEAAMEEMEADQEKRIVLGPEEAYGAYDATLVVEIDKKILTKEVGQIEAGQLIEFDDGRNFVIRAINKENVTLDGNHFLSGKRLIFSLKVISIREAAAEEIHQQRPLMRGKNSCGPGCCC